MLVPMFALLSFVNRDGSFVRMGDIKHYLSVTVYLHGSFGFYELIKVSGPTWDGYKTRQEKQEGDKQ